MNRLKGIWFDKHGCIRPDTGCWCPGCEYPMWRTDGAAEICPDCVEFFRTHQPAQYRQEM